MTTSDYIDAWFSFIEENPEKANPTATALLMALLREARAAGAHKLRITPEKMMFLVGVANYKTFKKAQDHLVESGTVRVLSEAKNQYTWTTVELIALVKNTKAHGKACPKHTEKHVQSTSEAHGKARPEQIPPITPLYTTPEEEENNTLSLLSRVSPESPVVVAGGYVDEPTPSKIETWIEEYKAKNPYLYPEGFYAETLNYLEMPSRRDASMMVWEVFSEKHIDKQRWLNHLLTDRWAQKKHFYPNWEDEAARKKIADETKSTGRISPQRHKKSALWSIEDYRQPVSQAS